MPRTHRRRRSRADEEELREGEVLEKWVTQDLGEPHLIQDVAGGAAAFYV